MAKVVKDKETQPANGLKRLKERLTKVSKYPSFPAYLRQAFDAFSEAIRLGGPTKWDEIAKWAMEEGYTGGKPIQPATAKLSYEREKQRRERAVKPPKYPGETRLNAPAAQSIQAKQEPAQNVSRPSATRPYGRTSKGKSIWKDDE